MLDIVVIGVGSFVEMTAIGIAVLLTVNRH